MSNDGAPLDEAGVDPTRGAARLEFFRRLLDELATLDESERGSLVPGARGERGRHAAAARLRRALDRAYRGNRSAWRRLAVPPGDLLREAREPVRISIPSRSPVSAIARLGFAAAIILVVVCVAAVISGLRECDRDLEGRPETVRASKTARLVGAVTGPDGKPLARARVRLLRQMAGAGRRSVHETDTDASGRYRLLELLSARYDLYVQVFGVRGYSAFIESLRLSDGEMQTRPIRIAPISLSGHVTRGEDGRPLGHPDVQIVLHRVRLERGKIVWRSRPFMAFADPEGRFCFFGLSPGPQEIWVHPADETLRDVRRLVDVPVSDLSDVQGFALERR